MRISRVAMQSFRNIGLASLSLDGKRHFFNGKNGQGKSNLLEAVGLLTAFRSFRTPESKQLIQHGASEATLVYGIEHEKTGESKVAFKFGANRKEIMLDENKVARLADFIGLFPTVILSSQDLQFVRGSPATRRRFLDLILAATDPGYLYELQNFHRALESRNKLLKQGIANDPLTAFEIPMAQAAEVLMRKRATALEEIGPLVTKAYAALSDSSEVVQFGYRPNVSRSDAENYRAILEGSRRRDAVMKSTQEGPHRDDFESAISGRATKDFASEGQQRSVVIAIRLAQIDYFIERLGTKPVILADDILGELDPVRRERFWSAVDRDLQVVATGTEFPANEKASEWQIYSVEQGRFSETANTS